MIGLILQMDLRKSLSSDPVFGVLQPLKTTLPTQLPTYSQIGKAVGHELRLLGVTDEFQTGDKVHSNTAAYKKVTQDVIKIYELDSIGNESQDCGTCQKCLE